MSVLGVELRYYRKMRKHTQESLAEILGVDKTYLSKIENGHEPSAELIAEMEKHLRLDCHELFYFSNQVPPEVVKKLVRRRDLWRKILDSDNQMVL